MSYEVKQGNIWGRIGAGLGQGMAEQIPKEIERYRLAEGLKQLGQKQGQTPFQQLAEFYSIPGITPQMIQSGTELLKQQAAAQSLKDRSMQKPEPIPTPYDQQKPPEETTTIETPQPLEETLEPYEPLTFEQLQQKAGIRLKQFPEYYRDNPDKAFEDVLAEEKQKEARSNYFQQKRINVQNVENNVRQALRNRKEELGAKIPATLFNKYEKEALVSLKPKSKGGEGLTEEQALQRYLKKMDDASRDYDQLRTFNGLTFYADSPSEGRRRIKALRQSFAKRDDLENFADSLVSEANISPQTAYELAFDIEDNKNLKKTIDSLSPIMGYSEPEDRELVFKKVAKSMTENDSPLAIGENLRKKGYPVDEWLMYLQENQDELGLKPRQVRELTKKTTYLPTLNDLWINSIKF